MTKTTCLHVLTLDHVHGRSQIGWKEKEIKYSLNMKWLFISHRVVKKIELPLENIEAMARLLSNVHSLADGIMGQVRLERK